MSNKITETNQTAIDVVNFITDNVTPDDNKICVVFKDYDDMTPMGAICYLHELDEECNGDRYTVEFIGHNIHIY